MWRRKTARRRLAPAAVLSEPEPPIGGEQLPVVICRAAFQYFFNPILKLFCRNLYILYNIENTGVLLFNIHSYPQRKPKTISGGESNDSS